MIVSLSTAWHIASRTFLSSITPPLVMKIMPMSEIGVHHALQAGFALEPIELLVRHFKRNVR